MSIPAKPKDYVPPPRPLTTGQRAFRLRVASILMTLFLVAGAVYLRVSGMSSAETLASVLPLAAIVCLVIAGLARGTDTLTRWIGYLGMIVSGAAFALAYATGK